jgi:hypothetical protein
MEPRNNNDSISFGLRIKHYYTQLNFNDDKQMLGPSNETWLSVAIYGLASLGIFCRHITQFPKVKINFANLQWSVLAASFIFGLAVLPFFIKRVNAVNSTPGIHQIITAFGVGFFMDFTTNAIINFYFK